MGAEFVTIEPAWVSNGCTPARGRRLSLLTGSSAIWVNDSMENSSRRTLVWCALTAFFVGAAIVFPRVRFFLEIAAREVRFLWWLFVLGAAALFLAFRLKPRR